MAKKSIKWNYIYNLTYQILLLLTPLITTPYLSRVFGAGGVGTVSFAESIVSYFTLFATLGITTFGQREISYVQDDRVKRTQIFWETKLLQVLTSISVLAVYIIFSLFQDKRTLYLVLSFNIIAVLVDVVWLFQGMEEFGKIVSRNFIFKVISIIYIFLAVKTKDDIVKYAFGIGLFTFLSNLSLWIYIFRIIGKPQWKKIKPMRNFKIVLSLFIPTVAISIYTVLDKTMIGVITNNPFENGYYEQAIKLSKMLLTVVTALGTVMIPRIGYHFGRGENRQVRSYMYRGYRFVWFLGIPLYFGLLGTATNFVPWFFGGGFEKVVSLLGILGFLIIAIGINNVTGMQYLIPTKRQNLFTMTVLIGAGVNFALNLILIYTFQSIGAAIASVVAETTIALVQLYLVRKELSIKEVFFSSWHYLLAGSTMLAVLIILAKRLSPSIVHTILMVGCGAIVYFIVLLLLRDSFFIDNARNMLGKIKTQKVFS
ncbi:MAG: flippase [Hungatella sp.]|nr:flippase [Hungatella sp.]